MFRRRFPLRLTLLTLIAALLLGTVATVGAVGYYNVHRSIRELFESRFGEISRGTADRVRTLLEPAASILSECRTQAERGMLKMQDTDSLGERLAERLRYEQRLTWLSYGDAEGRFTGARRGPEGDIILNRSWPAPDGTGRLLEQRIHPDGTRELVQSNENWTYDPRKRDWYKIGALCADGTTAWTEPYEWWNYEGLGITCVMSLRGADGILRGVFTADFHLQRISEFLRQLNVGQTGMAFVLTRQGKVICSPHKPGEKVDQALLDTAMKALPQTLVSLRAGHPAPVTFDHAGVRYAAAFEPFPLPGGLEWVAAVVVPEAELLGTVQKNTLWTIVIGVVSLGIALVAGNIFSARLARPLQQIATDLAQVGRFELTDARAPRTRIEEIAVVGDAVNRMKMSLRSFAHYVPTDLVRELLERGEEAKLGARLHPITIHFSDIEGFSRISETIPPVQMVEMLGRYFDTMTQIIAEHQGTLDKFIGDGVLAFYNAPTPVPDHAAQACHAALETQQRLAHLRLSSGILPPNPDRPMFSARVGLHTAEVLVGNIGTPSRFAYTVLGDGVNLANGIEALNKVYGTEILVSQETHDAAGLVEFEWRRVDLVAVKGRAKGGYIYELLGKKNHVADRVLQARDHYEQAMADYQARRWPEALAGFEAALQHRPKDRAARAMLVRARIYQETPPPAQWDSVYVHVTG
ncbi:MAG: adenylate/guanylate cyclase domain-containing protein [Tepidisphaeraceae bacterium]